MKMLPVHCCCTPDKRLGWVPVGESYRIGPIRFMTERPSWAFDPAKWVLTLEEPRHNPPRYNPPRYIETEVARLTLSRGGDTIIAVNSNDYPIEEWRKVRGFIEDREQQL